MTLHPTPHAGRFKIPALVWSKSRDANTVPTSQVFFFFFYLCTIKAQSIPPARSRSLSSASSLCNKATRVKSPVSRDENRRTSANPDHSVSGL